MTALAEKFDFVKSYQWMEARVRELELGIAIRPALTGQESSQLIPVNTGWAVGHNPDAGGTFQFYQPDFVAPQFQIVADHIQLYGAVAWVSGTDDRALLLPGIGYGAVPFETFEYVLIRHDNTKVKATITPDGYLHLTPGNTSPVVLAHIRYPLALEGG